MRQRLCAWTPFLDRASLHVTDRVLRHVKPSRDCGIGWPSKSSFALPRTDVVAAADLVLSIAANTLIVASPPIGVLRADTVVQDVLEFLQKKPVFRWPYCRAVGQALVRPTLPGIHPAVLRDAADLLCILAAILCQPPHHVHRRSFSIEENLFANKLVHRSRLFVPQIAIARLVLTSKGGGAEGDDQVRWSGHGGIAGRHCSVLWLRGRVTTQFGGVEVVPLLVACHRKVPLSCAMVGGGL